jgi:hypothetical protein
MGQIDIEQAQQLQPHKEMMMSELPSSLRE